MDKVEIEGLRELQIKLLELPKRLAKNVMRSAVSAGAAVIRTEIKQRAPVYTGKVSDGHPPPGTLKRAVVSKYIREMSSDFEAVFKVTVRKGKRFNKQGKKENLSQDAYYAMWVERGTAKMAARPFFRPGYEAKKQEALNAMIQKLKDRLEQEAKS